MVLHHDAGTKVGFVVWNVGAAADSATVTVYVDDQVQSWTPGAELDLGGWTSGGIAPGTSAGTGRGLDDGYMRGYGRHPAGRHVFRVVVTPVQSGQGSMTNVVDIDWVGIG